MVQCKSNEQEQCSKQVTESCQIGNGRIVRVNLARPKPIDYQLGKEQQDEHLNTSCAQIEYDEYWIRRRFTVKSVENKIEEGVNGNHQRQK